MWLNVVPRRNPAQGLSLLTVPVRLLRQIGAEGESRTPTPEGTGSKPVDYANSSTPAIH